MSATAPCEQHWCNQLQRYHGESKSDISAVSVHGGKRQCGCQLLEYGEFRAGIYLPVRRIK